MVLTGGNARSSVSGQITTFRAVTLVASKIRRTQHTQVTAITRRTGIGYCAHTKGII